MTWGPKARAAAAAARKRKGGSKTTAAQYRAHGNQFEQAQQGQKPGAKGRRQYARAVKGTTKRKDLPRSASDRAVGARWGAEMHSQVGKRKTISPSRTQPHKALPNTPVNHSLAAPMKAPGVAKPTGPQAFTHRAPGGKVGNSRMTPTAQARNYKSQAKSARTPVFGTKKRYPSSKRKGK